MGLGTPRILYGIHSISPYSQSSGVPYGILKVIGSANLALSSSIKELFAGSNKFSWTAETATIATSLTAKVKAYPGFLFQLFLGASSVDNAAETGGSVSALVNVLGTSVMKATTGVATLAVDSANKANLKFGQYVLKALTTNTLAIFLTSDVDSGRGVAVPYTDDSLKLTVAVGTITIATTVDEDLTDLGLTLTGGSSATAFVVGDTAEFSVRPPNTGSSDIIVGASTTTFQSFGMDMLAQKRTTQEMFEIRAHYVLGAGLPISLSEMAFSEPEIKMSCLYYAPLDRVFTIRGINPS